MSTATDTLAVAPADRLSHALDEAERAAREDRRDDAVRGLGHAIVLARAGGDQFSDVEFLQRVNSVTSTVARAVMEPW